MNTKTTYHKTAVEGLTIFSREAGSNDLPTVLLLHGFPSSSHMFRDLIPLLADDFHVIAPDYPGFGNSDCPPVDQFTYTFDRLADVVERFCVLRGLTRFSVYMQDYGGPVGMRLATRHPESIAALVVQNANLYEEGLSPSWLATIGPLWKRRTGATELPVLEKFHREAILALYQTGTRASESMNPDSWNLDEWGINRPGNREIQLDLQADYRTNVALYPTWQAYLKKYQPPTLVVWGKGDPVFGVVNAHRLRRDLQDVEVHVLDTGHFALEEEVEFIADHMRAFLRPRVARAA